MYLRRWKVEQPPIQQFRSNFVCSEFTATELEFNFSESWRIGISREELRARRKRELVEIFLNFSFNENVTPRDASRGGNVRRHDARSVSKSVINELLNTPQFDWCGMYHKMNFTEFYCQLVLLFLLFHFELFSLMCF